MNLRNLFRRHADDEPVHLGIGATFPADGELEKRIKQARAELPEDNVKRLILENPDFEPRAPLDYDAGLPIG